MRPDPAGANALHALSVNVADLAQLQPDNIAKISNVDHVFGAEIGKMMAAIAQVITTVFTSMGRVLLPGNPFQVFDFVVVLVAVFVVHKSELAGAFVGDECERDQSMHHPGMSAVILPESYHRIASRAHVEAKRSPLPGRPSPLTFHGPKIADSVIWKSRDDFVSHPNLISTSRQTSRKQSNAA